MKFSWSYLKATNNIAKHGISFVEARRVLENPLTWYEPDLDHDEPRLRAIGPSTNGRLLFVVCVELTEDHLRIISARRATRQERSDYEQHQ